MLVNGICIPTMNRSILYLSKYTRMVSFNRDVQTNRNPNKQKSKRTGRQIDWQRTSVHELTKLSSKFHFTNSAVQSFTLLCFVDTRTAEKKPTYLKMTSCMSVSTTPTDCRKMLMTLEWICVGLPSPPLPPCSEKLRCTCG